MTVGVDDSVTVIGAGAMGCWLAAHTAHSGTATTLLVKPHQLTPNGRGWVRAKCPEGDRQGSVVVTTTVPPDAALLIVAVKSGQTASVAAALNRHTGQVLSAQNGLGNLAAFAESGVAATPLILEVGADLEAPFTVRQNTPSARLLVGDPGTCGRLVHIGLPCTASADIDRELWRKAMINAAVNPITTLCGEGVGTLMRHSSTRSLVHHVLLEVGAAASAAGHPDIDVDQILDMLDSLPADKSTSTLADHRAGRPLEHELFDGILQRATAMGVATPRLATMTALLRALDPQSKPAV